MKRFTYIILASACVAALFSCSRKYEFQTNAYAIMETSSVTVKEDVGVVRIPVSAYNSEGLSGSVYFKVVDGTAVEGTDFTVEPASGVLSFSGNSTDFIEISVINHPGVLTGALKFSVELTSASGDISNLGGVTSATVEIQDNDVVVDWDYVAGEWTAQDYDGGSPDGGTYKVTIVKKNDTTLSLNNLYGGGNDIVGTITFDSEANTASISFEPNQLVWSSASYGGPMYLLGYNFEKGGWYTNTPAVATVTSGGIHFSEYTFIMSGSYAGYIWTSAGITTDLTK